MITGQIQYKNFIAQQHENIFNIFPKFLSEIKPNRVLEIGTANGGFILYIRDTLNECNMVSTEIWSFDVSTNDVYQELNKNNNLCVKVENIFNDDYTSINDAVFDYINRDGTVLIFCDGGNKTKEFNCLSKYLKKGDYIMAHDYIDTVQNYLDNFEHKIWNWHEICESDIMQACKTHQLIDYKKDIFDSIVWTCKYKVS